MRSQNILSKTEEQNFIFFPSRLKLLFLLALSILLVAVGIWVFLDGDPSHSFIGILCTGFFGLGILVVIFMSIKRRPFLIVDDVGFHRWSLFGWEYCIAWEEIDLIFPVKQGWVYALNIHISDSGMETLSARYPKSGYFLRLLTGCNSAISLAASPISAQRLIEAIQKRYQNQLERNGILIYL